MLTKLKELVKGIIQYLLDHPIQRVIVVALGVAVVATIISLIVVGAVKRKKRKAQQAACACANDKATEELAAEEIAPATQEETAEKAACDRCASAYVTHSAFLTRRVSPV